MKKEILEQLADEFTVIGPDGKQYPDVKWKVKSTKGEKALLVPYLTAPQIMRRLNSVLGVQGWSDTLIETSSDMIICEITINIDGEQITRSDVGVPSEYAKKKGMASDAFKRAAMKFGIGLYLKNLDNVELPKVRKGNKFYPSTGKGKILDTPQKQISYINQMHPQRSKLTDIYNSLTEDVRNENSAIFKKLWNLIK